MLEVSDYSQFSSAAKIWKKSLSKRQKYHLTNVLKFIIIWFYQPNPLEDTRIHFPSTHVINLKLIYNIWFVKDLSIFFKKISFIEFKSKRQFFLRSGVRTWWVRAVSCQKPSISLVDQLAAMLANKKPSSLLGNSSDLRKKLTLDFSYLKTKY